MNSEPSLTRCDLHRTTNSSMEFTHIRDELLDASDPNHLIRIAFSAKNITSLHDLQRFMKSANNIDSLTYTDDTTNPYRKDDIQICKEDLHALPSLLNMLQNGHGLRVTPLHPWAGGSYTLQINPRLEDLAGNSIERPFEVDLNNKNADQSKAEQVTFTLQP